MILQACPSCNRQYDISHLGAEDRVRCVCEEVFGVKPPVELTVHARKCTNCGGRIEPGETACAYCASALAESDLTSILCPSCFKRIETEAKHCHACGIAIEPQALTAIPDHRSCPRCEGALCLRSLGTSSVIECEACSGLWVKRSDFEAICKRAQDRPEIVLENRDVEQSIGAAEPERRVFYLNCPSCGSQMARRMFRYKNRPSRVIVDYCREHGVWFDREELEHIVSFIRSRADAEVPFNVADALGSRRPAYLAAPLGARHLASSGAAWDLGEGLATYFVAESIGGLLGGILGSLFD